MEAMRRGEPVPPGRPEPAGVEFEPVAVPSVTAPAADLFAAAGEAVPEMPAARISRRRKAKNRCKQTDLFDP